MTPERWRSVTGYDGLYEVSDRGRVRSLDRQVHKRNDSTGTLRGKVLSPRKGSSFCSVLLTDENGVPRCCTIGRLVLEAFVGPPPTVEHRAFHLDNDPYNCALDNLYWKVKSAITVCRVRGESNGQAILTDDAVREIRRSSESNAVFAARYDVHPSTIHYARRGITWKHVKEKRRV